MTECTFCGKDYASGTGFTIYKRDGSSVHYCSRKCLRQVELGRKAKKLKWTTVNKANKPRKAAAPKAKVEKTGA